MTTTPKLVADDIERLCKRLEAPIGYGGQNSEDGYEIHDKLRLEAAAALRRLAGERREARAELAKAMDTINKVSAVRLQYDAMQARATAAEAERDETDRENGRLGRDMGVYMIRATAAEARVAALEEAIRTPMRMPEIVEVGKAILQYIGSEQTTNVGAISHDAAVTVRNIIISRAALAAMEAGDGK